MSQGEENSDQSMEEILQSIKRIIADDEEPSESDNPGADTTDDNAADPADESVLELTELVSDDTAPGDNAAESGEEPEVDFGMMEMPEAETNAPKEEPLELTEPAQPEAPAPAVSSNEPSDGLVSDEVAAASSSLLNSLMETADADPVLPAAAPSMPFRSGATVEDLVKESLTPMLQDWLNANLQQIVERIVTEEVKRLSNR